MAKGKVTYKTGQNLEPIAQAITSMGQSANKKDKPDVLANKIKAISSDATGTEAEMLVGKTFYAAGQKKTGSMANRGAWTNRLGINSKIVIPAGYHNGQGYIDQSIATKGAHTYTPGTANQVINAGQYLSGAQTIAGDPNLIPSNIRKGKTIFGITGSFFGPTDAEYLFWNGNLMNDFTLDYTPVGVMGNKKAYVYNGYIWYPTQSHNDASDWNSQCFTKAIDLTTYNTFTFEVANDEKQRVRFYIGFATLDKVNSFNGDWGPYFVNNYAAYAYLDDSVYGLAKASYQIDISGLKGNYHLVIMSTFITGSLSSRIPIYTLKLS